MVDLDKLICSLLRFKPEMLEDFNKILADQGLCYYNGKIVKNTLFKVGEWVLDGNQAFLIKSIENNWYNCEAQNGDVLHLPIDSPNLPRLWKKSDLKPGDIIGINNSYFLMDSSGGNASYGFNFDTLELCKECFVMGNYHLATPEECVRFTKALLQYNLELDPLSRKVKKVFHPGEWVYIDGLTLLVVGQLYNQYAFKNAFGDPIYFSCEEVEDKARKWNLRTDAKNGDILISKDKNVCLIYDHLNEEDSNLFVSYCDYDYYEELEDFERVSNDPCDEWQVDEFLPANSDEIKKFFDCLEQHHYKWDGYAKKLMLKSPQEADDVIDLLVKEYEKTLPTGEYEMYGKALAHAYRQGLEASKKIFNK